MKDFINRILQLPKPQKLGILAGLAIVLLALDYFYLYSPRSNQISKLKMDIENARGERDKKKKLAADMPKLKQQLGELGGMLKEAVAQLPDRREIPSLLSSISTKAREAGLEILIFRPRAEDPKDFYAEIPVDIVVRGEFHNVVTFFDEVGRLSRLVNINNIELRNARVKVREGTKAKLSEDHGLIDSTTMATTFRFLDEAERVKIAAERAAKEKKGKKAK